MILTLGYRRGAIQSLERMKVPFIVWSEAKLKCKKGSFEVIVAPFPKSKEELDKLSESLKEITHVIALTERAVIPSSFIRKFFNLYRNPDTLTLRCTDKFKMKEFLSHKKIPMTKFASSKDRTAKDIIEELGLPLVCKKKLSSGGRGVFFTDSSEEVQKYINSNFYFEKVIKGHEGSIESFIINGKVVFSNITQYYKNGHCNILPAQFSDIIKSKIKVLNKDVLQALKIKWGMTHLEYYICGDEILFGEIALRPPGGYIMEALEQAYCQNFWDLFIQVELIKEDITINKRLKHASSIVIHPGVGKVKSIQGLDTIDQLKSAIKFKMKIQEGDLIKDRKGFGENTGHLILAHEDPKVLKSDIERFYRNFKVLMA